MRFSLVAQVGLCIAVTTVTHRFRREMRSVCLVHSVPVVDCCCQKSAVVHACLEPPGSAS